ncbi:flagellar biosynthetic protein FliR [Mesoterricola sediminis]|uniref:Flagellar biosynthetic protein FliR n=1 Tax=Mesoterricola sediminis TaxID=2927980 RepID=A0AA48KD01_9BACT|nr:flagellar biosynthetic protein FliR [Mesoterricola sediminis]BDU76565.1 flagellar biosynthetic protein FliR [Mesoterricola sediminis]
MDGVLASPAFWAFSQARILAFMLVLVRLTGLMATLPGFGQGRLPLQVRVTLVVLLALVLAPVVPRPPADVDGMWSLTGVMVTELAAGLIMGLSVAWIVDMAAFAGQLMDTQMGFSFVQFMDPVTARPASISGSLLTQLTLVLLLVAGLHHQMIRAFVESYRILPVGLAVPVDPQLVIARMGMILVRGFQLAFPVLFALFIIDFVAGISGKFMPQLQLITLTFPLKIAVGLAILGVLLREFGPWLGPFLEAAPREALRLLVRHG